MAQPLVDLNQIYTNLKFNSYKQALAFLVEICFKYHNGIDLPLMHRYMTTFIKIKNNHGNYNPYHNSYEAFMNTWNLNIPHLTIKHCQADKHYRIAEQPIFDVSGHPNLTQTNVCRVIREARDIAIHYHSYFNRELVYAYATSFFTLLYSGVARPYRPCIDTFEHEYQQFVYTPSSVRQYERDTIYESSTDEDNGGGDNGGSDNGGGDNGGGGGDNGGANGGYNGHDYTDAFDGSYEGEFFESYEPYDF
jgi:uncharacterized membrane protein YgcG